MAIATGVHSNGTSPAFGSATTVTTSSVTSSATGSTFVLCIDVKASSISSVSDSYSNTYTLKQTGTGFNSAAIYVCDNGSGGAGHTATVNVSATDAVNIHFIEITGAANPSFDAGGNGSDTNGGTSFTGASVTTANASDLVLSFFAGYSDGGTVSSTGTGFTLLDAVNGGGVLTSGVSYKVVSATGTYNDTYTNSAFNYAAFSTIGLKAASGGGPVTVALTGQSGTFTAGTLTHTTSKALTGQAGTLTSGTLAPSTTVGLTGSQATFTPGTVTPSGGSGGNVTVALTGQRSAFAQGAFGVSVAAPLVGQSSTATAGTLAPGTSTSLTGSSATFSTGLLTPSLAVQMLGSVLSGTPGTISPGMAFSLTGNLGSFTQGSLIPSTAVTLSGIFQPTSTGQMISSGGDIVITQTGSLLLIRRGSRKKR